MRRAFAPFAVAALLFTASAVSAAERDSAQWMEILMHGKKIGFSRQSMRRTPTGFRIESRAVMKVEVAGAGQDISTSSTYFLDPSYRPLRFTYMQKMLNHRQFFDGVVKGDHLEVRVESAGNVTVKTVPFEGQTYMADAMAFLMGQKKLKEGDKYSFRVFMEPLMASADMTVEVNKMMEMDFDGKKETVYPVTMRMKDFLTVSYFTTDGRLLREISPMGFVSQAVDEQRAVRFPDGPMSFTSLLAFSLVPVEPPFENARAMKSLSVTVSGLSGPDLLPGDARQKPSAARKVNGKNGAEYAVALTVRANGSPAARRIARPLKDPAFADYLKADIEAQSDDPAIMEAAARIVGDETDLWRAAVKINRWVFEKVEKKYVDTFSAVATLKSMEGECQSHTNLFAALARATGIPTRTVSGIVYSEEFKGFLYHAWPEVWAGEWVAMDPTFGQEIADATHIKLAEGDLSSQLKLFSFIGKIGIETARGEQR